MKKNIYSLLNEVTTDFTEYEIPKLSPGEKELRKKRILKKIGALEQKNGKKKLWVKAAAAACVIVIGGTAIATPALAKDFFDSLFAILMQNSQGEKYEEEYTELYHTVGEKSVTVQSEIEKQKDGGYATTATDNGVTLSVSDIYCDGYLLYFTASLETENEALAQADGILTGAVAGGDDGDIIRIDGLETFESTYGNFTKSQDGSYAVVAKIDLLNPALREEPASLEIDGKDSLTIDWTVRQFAGVLYDQWDEQGEYLTTGDVKGEWRLRFPVTIDRSENETISLGQQENGILLKSAVKTKVGLILEAELPDFRQKPYCDPHNDPNLAIKDSKGTDLQWLTAKSELHEDGTSSIRIMVLYEGQKNLSFEVTTRDEAGTEIADIAFQLP